MRLATGTVSTIGGLWDLVRRAMGSSGLLSIGLSGGFGMTTLGHSARRQAYSLTNREYL